MEDLNINWNKLKKSDYSFWRENLREKTLELLTSPDANLSSWNEYGFFHRVRNPAFFRQMEAEWKANGKAPQEWISKGDWPGIWTALFDPHNTYSLLKGPLYVTRLYLKNGYCIYNPENAEHMEMWKAWPYKESANKWEKAVNKRGRSLSQRLKEVSLGSPYHKSFFEESGFGALIGFSDYISAVILLEDSIEKADFLYL